MGNLLKAGAALLALAAGVAVLALVLAPLERGRGQPAALAPTPTPNPGAGPPILTNLIITPTVSPTPRPPILTSPIITPTFGPVPTPTPPVVVDRTPPPPTPRPATGGPYIDERRAIEIAVDLAGTPGNRINEAVPPRGIFTAAKNVNAILGDPRPPSTSEREKWVVVLEGVFTPFSRPAGAPPSYYSKMYVVVDATAGEWSFFALREQIPSAEVEKP